MMAPHGHGPLGGKSRFRLGIQPVEPINRSGSDALLTSVAPERDKKLRQLSLRTGPIQEIMNGIPEGQKLPECKLLFTDYRVAGYL
jgi:hypothetical protein